MMTRVQEHVADDSVGGKHVGGDSVGGELVVGDAVGGCQLEWEVTSNVSSATTVHSKAIFKVIAILLAVQILQMTNITMFKSQLRSAFILKGSRAL